MFLYILLVFLGTVGFFQGYLESSNVIVGVLWGLLYVAIQPVSLIVALTVGVLYVFAILQILPRLPGYETWGEILIVGWR